MCIRDRVNNYVVQLIREQIEINKHTILAHSMNIRSSSIFHSPLPQIHSQQREGGNLIYSSSTPLQVHHGQCASFEATSKSHLEPIPFPPSSTEETPTGNDIRHPSPLPRSCNNTVMKLPTPRRKIDSNGLFSDAYLNADIIPNPSVESAVSMDRDNNTNSGGSSMKQYGIDDAADSRTSNLERPSSSSSRLGVRSRSITPRQKIEYSHVHNDDCTNEMLSKDKDSLQPQPSVDTTITSSTPVSYTHLLHLG